MDNEIFQKIAEESFVDELQKTAFNIKTDKKALLLGLKHVLGQKATAAADSASAATSKAKEYLKFKAQEGKMNVINSYKNSNKALVAASAAAGGLTAGILAGHNNPFKKKK